MVLPGLCHAMSCFACPEFICRNRFRHEAARLSVSPPGSGAARGFAWPGPCAAGAAVFGQGAAVRLRPVSPPVPGSGSGAGRGGGRLRSSSLLPRRGAGPFSARILRGRVLAPARFAHLIARARQRAHFSCRLLTGFQKLAPPGRAAPGKRLRISLPWGPSYHNPPDVKPISQTKLINIGNCSYFLKAGKGGYGGPASRPSSSRRPRPPRMRAAARSIWRFARK